MSPSRTIVVAGAGIGGLTAALALARRGFRVVVLEKAERLEQIGAGVQISPNASRILIELGLRDALAATAITPEAVSLNTVRSGSEVARLDLGDTAAFRAGAPYWVIHRADLQAALLAAATDMPAIELRFGWQFEDAVPHARGVTVGLRREIARAQEPALALVGADGVWSAVRHLLFPDWQPQFAGLIAWRGTLDARLLPRDLIGRRVQLWLGPNAHLVGYPVSGGRAVNVVAILPGGWNRPGWSAPGEANEIKARFAEENWPAQARMMIGAVDDYRRFALFTLEDRGDWSKGPIALLGDAAHAMLPFAAQGAGMAIEDAAVLAKCLGEPGSLAVEDVPAALRRYAGQRHARVSRIMRTAKQSGRIYHLSGPAAIARDLAMRTLGGARILARQDWIYDWRV